MLCVRVNTLEYIIAYLLFLLFTIVLIVLDFH